MKLKRFFLNLLLLTGSLLFVAYAFSAALWVKDLSEKNRVRMYQFDKKLGWRFIPGKTGAVSVMDDSMPVIQINPEGYRDRPFSEIPPSAKKVAVLGDSFVTNVKVKPNEVFTEILEKKMPGTSVMNFGVNGYGQTQEYLQLDEVLSYKPGLVIIFIYIENDFLDNIHNALGWFNERGRPYIRTEDPEFKITPPAPPPPLLEQFHFPKPTRFYYFLLEKIDAARYFFEHRTIVESPSPSAEWDFISTDLIDIHPRAGIDKQYTVMEHLLVKIAEKLQSSGVPFFFAIAPSKYQIEEKEWREFVKTHPEGYELLYANRRLIEILKKNQFLFLDLYPRLKQETDGGTICYDPYELHWNVAGNRIVAEELQTFIVKQKPD